MTLRRKLDLAHTKSVSCSNSTSDEPQYVGVSQQQDINEDTRSLSRCFAAALALS